MYELEISKNHCFVFYTKIFFPILKIGELFDQLIFPMQLYSWNL